MYYVVECNNVSSRWNSYLFAVVIFHWILLAFLIQEVKKTLWWEMCGILIFINNRHSVTLSQTLSEKVEKIKTYFFRFKVWQHLRSRCFFAVYNHCSLLEEADGFEPEIRAWESSTLTFDLIPVLRKVIISEKRS